MEDAHKSVLNNFESLVEDIKSLKMTTPALHIIKAVEEAVEFVAKATRNKPTEEQKHFLELMKTLNKRLKRIKPKLKRHRSLDAAEMETVEKLLDDLHHISFRYNYKGGAPTASSLIETPSARNFWNDAFDEVRERIVSYF